MLVVYLILFSILEEEDDPDSYGLGYPDYDVTERLKEINEQWDKEPLPDSSRQRLIEFKQVYSTLQGNLKLVCRSKTVIQIHLLYQIILSVASYFIRVVDSVR